MSGNLRNAKNRKITLQIMELPLLDEVVYTKIKDSETGPDLSLVNDLCRNSLTVLI